LRSTDKLVVHRSEVRSVAGLIPRVGAPLPYAVSRPIELVEVELAPLDEGEVLVRIEADGICHSDLSVVNGTRKHPLPIVGGHESAGIDAEVGPGLRDLRVGTTSRASSYLVVALVRSARACFKLSARFERWQMEVAK